MVHIIGCDSETCEGEPITFQFFGKGVKKLVWLDSGRHATREFFKALSAICPARSTTIIYGFNLDFDLVSFLWDRHQILRDEEIEFDAHGWHAEGVFSHVVFMRFTKGRRTVHLIDAMAFYKTSLAKAADLFCPGLPKLARPKDLGKVRYKKNHPTFPAYAMRDAEITYHIGLAIQAMHEEYDVQQCVSGPHMAARVFRHKFLKLPIPLPPNRIIYSALHSYHGGKNNLAGAVGWHRKIYSLDIKSAYPAAMARLPSFSNPKAYKTISGDGHPATLPELGIYKVWGKVKKCSWPIIYSHDFKPLHGRIEGVWTTGPELLEAMRAKEIKIEKIEGYFYDKTMDNEPSPFKAYVELFFKLKDTAHDPIKRAFYKILLNSLYGKFIQSGTRGGDLKNLVWDCDNETLNQIRIITAGGLFNPFVASLITGFPRAWIHKMEHDYRAIHTATDGIFTQIKPKEIPGLGGQSLDAEGDALIFRNKCYIVYGPRQKPKNGKKSLHSSIFPNKDIIKYATHGFHGRIFDLEKLYSQGKSDYHYVKVNKLRESLRRNLTVNKFEQRKATLNTELIPHAERTDTGTKGRHRKTQSRTRGAQK
jgi:hypothetical protein